MLYAIFNTWQHAQSFEDAIWLWYRLTQPAPIVDGNNLYGFRNGLVDESVITTRYFPITETATGNKFWCAPLDNLPEDKKSVSYIAGFSGEIKTYEEMINLGYILTED